MTSRLLIGNTRIDIVIERSSLHLPVKDIFRWVESAAESVTTYYGRFPVPQVLIRITPFEGRGVRDGMTFGDRGGRITIRVGSDTSPSELASDWMLTHEMVHLAFPSVDEKHHWIEEGIATYVEPIARIRVGDLTADQMWLDLVRDMPQGLPQVGDRGLDHTHTWGRTYWGGALFCLLADVEIRRQTNNAQGLEHALRGILEADGDIRREWDLEEALRVGDRAVGVSVLQPLYRRMKDKPVSVDLATLWSQLGVQSDGARVRFDDSATPSRNPLPSTWTSEPASRRLSILSSRRPSRMQGSLRLERPGCRAIPPGSMFVRARHCGKTLLRKRSSPG